MVLVYRQDMLRQCSPPQVKATPEPESKKRRRGAITSERVKRLPDVWFDKKKTAEDIAEELGFPSAKAVYQAALRVGLVRRYKRGIRAKKAE